MEPRNTRAVLCLCLFALMLFSSAKLESPTYQDVHSVPVTIQLPSVQLIESSPGLKFGSIIACERVCVPGLQRFAHLKKYAHLRRIKVQYSQGISKYSQKIELCIHRNASLSLGQCEQHEWKALEKGSWIGIMSPYETKFMDIRMQDTIFGSLTISVEEEFQPYRLAFLGLGLVMLILAPTVSKWVPFYFSSAMAFGIILVILIFLFQVMKLLPTGRKSTAYIVLYGSIVGFGSVILHYLSGLVHSILEELGFGEEMFNPVALFLLLCIVFTGAGLGFWGVRKLVLLEDGSVDRGISQFVTWVIRIVASVMFLQSSYDSLLSVLMLIAGVTFTTTLRAISSRSKKRSLRRAKHSSLKNSRAQFLIKTPTNDAEVSRSQGPPLKWSPYSPHIASPSLATPSPVSHMRGSPLVASKKTPSPSLYMSGTSSVSPTNTPSIPTIDEQDFYSTFHKTHQRKHFSKEEWEKFTKNSTKKALRELVSTYDFTKWARENADRLILSPQKIREDSDHSENDSEVGVSQENSRGGGGWFGW
ncbi:hypothetical protein SUGI_0575730 [Cryptomeria japonica]|nr:hypothetical protein SUGI_0575730 [Cryptomeria japonica]